MFYSNNGGEDGFIQYLVLCFAIVFSFFGKLLSGLQFIIFPNIAFFFIIRKVKVTARHNNLLIFLNDVQKTKQNYFLSC